MLTTAVSSHAIDHESGGYFQKRAADLQKLGQALRAGDLEAARQQYKAIQDLGQSGPFSNGDPFKMAQREQAFETMGQALQSGDLGSAQRAFHRLISSFRRAHIQPPPDASPIDNVPSNATSAGNGSEIVLNLANMPAGEQITIGLNNTGNGTEQVTISMANQQGQSPEQITLNVAWDSNQQIILNLFRESTSAPSTGALSVTG